MAVRVVRAARPHPPLPPPSTPPLPPTSPPGTLLSPPPPPPTSYRPAVALRCAGSSGGVSIDAPWQGPGDWSGRRTASPARREGRGQGDEGVRRGHRRCGPFVVLFVLLWRWGFQGTPVHRGRSQGCATWPRVGRLRLRGARFLRDAVITRRAPGPVFAVLRGKRIDCQGIGAFGMFV